MANGCDVQRGCVANLDFAVPFSDAKIAQVLKDEPFPVIYNAGDVDGYYGGGPDILPDEQSFDFGYLKETGLSVNDDYSYFAYIVWLKRIYEIAGSPIPLSVDVGSFGSGVMSFDPLRYIGKLSGAGTFAGVDLASVRVAGARPSGFYIKCPVESLSQVFRKGKRANVIMASNVMTCDRGGAYMGNREAALHNLNEVRESLMPGGLFVNYAIMTGVCDQHLQELGFEVLFSNGETHVARKGL